MIEVIELSSDSNPEVEINVGEDEAPEVESPGFVLPDSPGYNPTSPEGVAQSLLYSPTSSDYFPSHSLYSPTSGPISSDFLETEKEVEAIEEVASELAAETVELAAPRSALRSGGSVSYRNFLQTLCYAEGVQRLHSTQ